MVIQALAKWISQNFPECVTKTMRNSVQCNTLFIDAFQLYFNALENSEDNESFIKKYLSSVKNAILSNNPTDKIFIFLDGPCPAIRFQKLRERWFVTYHVDDYVIDPSEYNLEDIQTNDEDGNEKLEEYIKKLINYDDVTANSIVFSSPTTPGEAKYKFFDYFREMKKSSDFVPSRKHVILSNTNEMFFLALQFIDEQFYVLKSNHYIYDIDLLRNFILYHMAIEDPFPGLKDNSIDKENLKKRKKHYKSIVSKMSEQLKQQIINDVIALSIVVSSENFPPFPEIGKMGNNAYTYAKLLNSYKELNQSYIESQIKMNSSDELEFTSLIVDNCFDLSSLKKIMKRFLQTYFKKNHSRSKKIDDEISSESSDDDDEPNLKSKHKRKEELKQKNGETKNIFDISITNNEYDDYSSDTQKEEEEINNSNREEEENDKSDSYSDEDDNDKFNEKDADDFQSESQQLFRLFNFTWKLYTEGCISWSFYYQFKKSPPLEIALDLMKQENLDVFETEDSDEITEPMFKSFVIFPVEVDDFFPHCLYKLKLPGSPISHFWPLGATDSKDIPIIDLKLIKKFYKKAKDKIPENERKDETPSETYEIEKKQKKKKTKRYEQEEEEDIFNKAYYRNRKNVFDDYE